MQGTERLLPLPLELHASSVLRQHFRHGQNTDDISVGPDSRNALCRHRERPDIDSGEAVLFAALHQSPDDRMLSGDKKAFVALSKIDARKVTDSLWARLICLEEALVLILKHGNFEQVSAKVRARSDVDMTLSMAFGRSQAAEESNVFDTLASYAGQLHRDTRQLWIPLKLKGIVPIIA